MMSGKLSPAFNRDIPRPGKSRRWVALGDWVVFQLLIYLFIDLVAVQGIASLRVSGGFGLPVGLFQASGLQKWPIAIFWCASLANLVLFAAECVRRGDHVPLIDSEYLVSTRGRVSIKGIILLLSVSFGTTVTVFIANSGLTLHYHPGTRMPYFDKSNGFVAPWIDLAWLWIALYPLLLTGGVIFLFRRDRRRRERTARDERNGL